MRRVRILASVVLTTLLVTSPARAHKSKGGGAKGQDGGKGFEEAVKDMQVIEGLFTFYFDEKENRFLMEIAPDQIGKTYLCSTAREAGDGRYYDSGSMGASFPFLFEKVGKKIRMLHRNVYYRSEPDAPIAGAIARGLTNSLFASAELESEPHGKRGSFLVDPAKLFLKDHSAVAASLGNRKLDYSFDRDGSYFARVRSFPKNSEIETVLHFTSKQPRATGMRIPDSRSMIHRYRFSLVEIPESDYVPRYADDRVGNFITMFQDFTDLEKDTPYTRYVNRWNLRKQDPAAELSPPVTPIVYWLENTVPEEYRDAIREGALLWNTAFEELGFRDAVVVKQMPADAEWDPADVRYNTIRWIVNPGGSYAVGPSHANPFTGELYAADIRISADFVRAFFRGYEEYIDPLSSIAEVAEGLDAPPDPFNACRYSQGKAMEAGFGADWMASQGFIDPDSPEVRRYIHDGIVDLVVHEVGHTLGFRHNFRASTIHDLRQVHDEEVTGREGISGSVMDYNPVNISPDPGSQGRFWCTNLGTYDHWVARYSYLPTGAATPDEERDVLDGIAARYGEPLLPYATDEDAFGFGAQGIDPVTNMWDMGPDPIAFYDERLDLADRLIDGLEDRFGKDGARYPKMRSVFGRAMRQYAVGGLTVSKYVGGIYHRRDHVKEGGALPFQPVSAAKQREALGFLNRRIFAADAFPFPSSLANKLAPERLADFDFSVYYQSRVDYPLHAAVLATQRAALNRLYHPITLNRMLDLPLHVANGDDAFTMNEMFRSLRGSIWSEVSRGANVNSIRRNLQRAHLDRLVSLAVRPQGAPFFTPSSGREPAGQLMPPEDARSFARADLVAIGKDIDGALKSAGLNGATRAHLDECRARIDAALTAGIERRM